MSRKKPNFDIYKQHSIGGKYAPASMKLTGKKEEFVLKKLEQLVKEKS